MIRHLGAIAGAVVLLAACSSGDGPEAGAPASTSPLTSATRSPTPTPTIRVQSCADLLERRWQPPGEEAPDFSSDPTTGIVRVTFTGEQLVLDLRSDPLCFDLPVIGRMLRRSLDDQ